MHHGFDKSVVTLPRLWNLIVISLFSVGLLIGFSYMPPTTVNENTKILKGHNWNLKRKLFHSFRYNRLLSTTLNIMNPGMLHLLFGNVHLFIRSHILWKLAPG